MIDIHCHLELLKDLDSVVERAKKKGVDKIVTAGTDVKTNRFSLEKSNEYPEVECMLGIYPDDGLKMSDEEIENEIEFIRKNKENVVGIGEVGMDFKHTKDKGERERQEKIFRSFVRLAMGLDKPILVHSREAEKECIEILESMDCKKVIMHCFSGSIELVKRIAKNDWYLSIPTCICYNKHFEDVVSLIPKDKLFCETDSPFMHPERKGKNEPGNVVASYERIAKIKKISLEEVEKEIEKNYRKLFT